MRPSKITPCLLPLAFIALALLAGCASTETGRVQKTSDGTLLYGLDDQPQTSVAGEGTLMPGAYDSRNLGTGQFTGQHANDFSAQNIEYKYEFADTRRSVYTPAFRNKRLELFEVFDFGDINATQGARNASNVNALTSKMRSSASANRIVAVEP